MSNVPKNLEEMSINLKKSETKSFWSFRESSPILNIKRIQKNLKEYCVQISRDIERCQLLYQWRWYQSWFHSSTGINSTGIGLAEWMGSDGSADSSTCCWSYPDNHQWFEANGSSAGRCRPSRRYSQTRFRWWLAVDWRKFSFVSGTTRIPKESPSKYRRIGHCIFHYIVHYWIIMEVVFLQVALAISRANGCSKSQRMLHLETVQKELCQCFEDKQSPSPLVQVIHLL